MNYLLFLLFPCVAAISIVPDLDNGGGPTYIYGYLSESFTICRDCKEFQLLVSTNMIQEFYNKTISKCCFVDYIKYTSQEYKFIDDIEDIEYSFVTVPDGRMMSRNGLWVIIPLFLIMGMFLGLSISIYLYKHKRRYREVINYFP